MQERFGGSKAVDAACGSVTQPQAACMPAHPTWSADSGVSHHQSVNLGSCHHCRNICLVSFSQVWGNLHQQRWGTTGAPIKVVTSSFDKTYQLLQLLTTLE